MAKPTTSGFTISGLLDRSASTRNDYPVERIPIEEIADHPANAAYSMDEAGIAQLAKSIEEEGLTDLPLVRKLDDGARKRPSRAQALRVEGGKPAERAGQAGAREDLENGQQAPWTHLVPCRRPKGLLHRFQQVAYLVYTR